MNKKKNNKLIDDYQKEALQSLDNNQALLFMKKSYREFLDSSFNPKNNEVLSLEEMEELQKRHHIDYIEIFREQSFNKARLGEYGIFEATFDKLIDVSVFELSKNIALNSLRLNTLMMSFFQNFNSLYQALILAYDNEEKKHDISKFNNYEENDLLHTFIKMDSNTLINKLIKRIYSYCNETIKAIDKIDNEIKSKSDLKKIFEKIELNDSLSENTLNYSRIVKKFSFNVLELYESYLDVLEDFESLSEDGFKLIRESLAEAIKEDDIPSYLILPKNYVYNMKEFKVERRAFSSDS